LLSPGSIIHQLVRSARGGEVEPWISEEKITTHFSAPILTNPDGSERSLWPARWSMEFLNEYRHTRAFAKNYLNDPMGGDGSYWTDRDFIFGELSGVTKRILSVDPAVTTKTSSDPTGLAVVGYSPSTGKAIVERSVSVRLTGRDLRAFVIRWIEDGEEDGRPIGGIIIETNQGGELWERDVFFSMPCPVKSVHQTVKKEVRAAETLSHYQRHRVHHLQSIRSLEEQMVSFPGAPHDDEVDAVGTAVNRFLTKVPTKRVGMRVANY
jgi:phage terminase large subunit-like protein